MIIELLILLLTLAIGWSYLEKRIQNFPPGPIGLPLLGHLPMLGKNPHKTFWKWKKSYGPLIGVWFGYYRSVVINDTKLIREALNMNCFSGRPKLNLFKAIRGGDGIIRGLILSDGYHWSEQRRFALRNLRDFGFGTKTMEAKVQDELDELMERLRDEEGNPIQVRHLFNSAVVNALWSIMFGDRITSNDPDYLAVIEGLTGAVDDSNFLGKLPMFLPWLAKIAPKLSGFEKMIKNYPIIQKFLRKQITIHNEHYVENQPRDLVDAFTDEVKKTTDINSSFHAENDNMVHSLDDLFSAGAETTSTTLSWLCAYLINHPRVQKKLQDEIDEVVGRQRIPSLSDRILMPYTEAVINEVMRFSSIFPLSVFRSATEDVNFRGFFIPKDTIIIPNLYGIHFDETVWGDPENFRPERFIDSKGKFEKNENLLPFSTGKRSCLGENLARDELFLFTTNLFQTFNASSPGKLPSLEPHLGLSLSPQPFEMILKRRTE